MHFIIRRGGHGPKTYWAGFKFINEGLAAQPKNPRLKWSKDIGDAVRFVREADADHLREGLRMYRLEPRVIKVD